MTPMNLERELDLHLTRRQFFGLTARGIGVGRARLAARPRRTRAAIGRRRPSDRRARRPAALRAEGEARHLPAPVRRAVAARDCSTTSRRSRSSRARRFPTRCAMGQRVAQTMGQSPLPVAQIAVQVRAARQVRHVGQRAAAAHREDRRRHHRHQDDEHRRDQSRSRRSRSSRPAPSSRAGRAWARGSATASAARTRTCRRSSCCCRRRTRINADQPLFSRLWGSGFLPSSYQGVRFRAGSDAGALPRRSRRASTHDDAPRRCSTPSRS